MSRSPSVDGTTSGVAWGGAAAIAFGTLAIAAKFGYRAGATPLSLLAARFVVAAMVLGAYHLVLRKPLGVTPGQARRLGALGVVYGLESFLFFAALENAPAGVVSLVFYSFPLWTVLLGLATRLERFRPALVVALASGTAGVALIFTLPRSPGRGVALALVAALAVAVYLLLVQVLLPDMSPTTSATWTALIAALTLVAVTLVVQAPLPSGALVPAASLGLATAFAFGALYASIARIGSARAGIAMMLEPVTTLALAAVILEEAVEPRMIAGSVLIVAALPILTWTRRADPGEDTP
ncbi:MAG: DMT family transporter [Actinomycetota bacterium]